MRAAANRRRSTRNRRNRQQPTNEAPGTPTLRFSPKLKYLQSCHNEDGIFMVSKRKRALPSPEEIEAKKMKKLQVAQRKYFVVALRHKVINLWLHGANFGEWHFGAQQTRKCIEFLQTSYPKYEKFAAAKSFVYRSIDRFREADPMPSADPFRDLRGENKPKNKRTHDPIVELCDELFSEPKSTAPKVQRALRRHNFNVSLSTIYRIAKDLTFRGPNLGTRTCLHLRKNSSASCSVHNCCD